MTHSHIPIYSVLSRQLVYSISKMSGVTGGGFAVQTNLVPALAAPFAPSEEDDEKKKQKKRLFGFGKKRPDDVATGVEKPLSQTSSGGDVAPPREVPNRKNTKTPDAHMLSSSPRIASPAGSQIFERDVQESAALMPTSPAIPSHITTENHIPPVLDASSEAIIDDHLDPDTVEIITHTSHQPAAHMFAGASLNDQNLGPSWVDELNSFAEREESASNYGSLDTSDVRRLSFISFADVVQAEQASHTGAGSRESVHIAGLTSLASLNANRSTSPIRSPVSSQGPDVSPPASKTASMKGVESPSWKPLASPTASAHPGQGNSELNIETMSQALRRTASSDLSGVRSVPTSPIEGPSR